MLAEFKIITHRYHRNVQKENYWIGKNSIFDMSRNYWIYVMKKND